MPVFKANSVVDYITDRIQNVLDGHWSDPETWKAAIAKEGCSLQSHKTPGLALGQYFYNAGYPLIYYSVSIAPLRQSRILCHELAHHIGMSEATANLFDGRVYGYENSNALGAREDIAIEVEKRFFGER